MNTKSKDIIFLLGAGASAEAGIPVSAKMIGDIEILLDKDKHWTKFRPLYNHVKSAIFYSAGLRGEFNSAAHPNKVNYNIEVLANTLNELSQNEQHPLYPFVATWNTRFVGLAGDQFSYIREFRDLIVGQLKSWTQMEQPKKAEYFKGFKELQNSLQFPLKIFSLNYDLCVEKIADEHFRVETGFNGQGEEFLWEWKRFDESSTDPGPPEIYLYKLHGSINWKRDDEGNLYSVEMVSNVGAQEMQVIFGTNVKLEAADPYLFYAFEFRRCSLEAKIIFVLGYGFGDDHINKMMAQAVRADSQKRIVVVANVKTDEEEKQKQTDVAGKLKLPTIRISIIRASAKEFLTSADLSVKVIGLIPEPAKVEF